MSWGDPRVDIFGRADDSSLWHKYSNGLHWEPEQAFELIPARHISTPSVSSWGPGRLDIVYVNEREGNVLHKYFGGGQWGPSWDHVEDLGGESIVSVVSSSWGDERLDLVGLTGYGVYVHKAWTGYDWYPSVSAWEHLGSGFASYPAIGSWGSGRLDIVGITTDSRSIAHKYWHEGWSEWEDLGGGPFTSSPKITSWGVNRFDIWTLDEEGRLNHLFWDGQGYGGWENLGGRFEDTPEVVHWEPGRIDIVGKTGETYKLKTFDGQQWLPQGSEWYSLGSSFDSEPSVIARRGESKSDSDPSAICLWLITPPLSDTSIDFISVYGVDKGQVLRTQVWAGSHWVPSAQTSWPLGKLPHAGHGRTGEDRGQYQSLLNEI